MWGRDAGHLHPTLGAGRSAECGGAGLVFFSPHPLPEVCHKGEMEAHLSGKNEMIPKVAKALRDPLGRKVLRK